eukprot:TRINITY_DN13861_c0_g1_i1.p1 TRINITY_DN13861_c0_g1~~TRINITY_DN13861_c0_g1_i1.p1  ORF type:complete len:391 (+),score=130.17 TRINITY_DN13861_c0_g1_i1:48-1220(+)
MAVTTDSVAAAGRLDADRAMVLVEQHWPSHEATQYKQRCSDMVKASPPLWRAQTVLQQKVPPSDAARAQINVQRPESDDAPFARLQETPSSELKHRTKSDRYAPPCPGVQRTVMRLWNKSHVRTPLLWHVTECTSTSWHKMSDFDGEPFESVESLGKRVGSDVVRVRLTDPLHDTARQECMTKLESCLRDGNWLFVVEKGVPCHSLYREIGRRLYCLEPEALKFPRREHFRLWVKVETAPGLAIDLNANVSPYFPDIFTQNAILATKSTSKLPGCKLRQSLHPRMKLVRRLSMDTYGHPGCQNMHREQVSKHVLRVGKGRDSDSESDNDFLDNPDLPANPNGAWFVRAGEMAKSSHMYGVDFRPSDCPPPEPPPAPRPQPLHEGTVKVQH